MKTVSSKISFLQIWRNLYSTGDGQVFQTKNFYNVEMPGKEGMIPNYILKTLEEEALEIKFNLDDLSTLYDERNIKIDGRINILRNY